MEKTKQKRKMRYEMRTCTDISENDCKQRCASMKFVEIHLVINFHTSTYVQYSVIALYFKIQILYVEYHYCLTVKFNEKILK